MPASLKKIQLNSQIIIVFSLLAALIIFALSIYAKDIQPARSVPYIYMTDLVSFYTAGRIIISAGPSHLYDLNLQYSYQHRLDPSVVYSYYATSPYFNPPFLALFLVPIAFLPFNQAYLIDFGFNLLCLILLCYLVFISLNRTSLTKRMMVITGILTFLPIDNSLLVGQFSILMSLILLFSWRLLNQSKTTQAGLILSLLLIKPYLIILPLIFFALQKQFQVLKGMVIGGGLLFLISLLLVGWSGLVGYFQLLLAASNWNYQFEVFANLQYNLQNLLMTLLSASHPRDIFIQWLIVCLMVFLATTFLLFNRKSSLNSHLFALKWAALVLIMLLLSPHTHFHDLSLLVVPAVLLLYLKQEKDLKINNWLIDSIIIIGYLSAVFLRTRPVSSTRQIELEIVFILIVLFFLPSIFASRHKLWYTTTYGDV